MAKTVNSAKAGRGEAATKDRWDLGLLYASPEDPKLERDLKAIEKACAAFEKTWRPQVAKLAQPKVLAAAMRGYEALSEIPGHTPGFYLFLAGDLDTANDGLRAKLALVGERAAKAGNRLEFFSVALAKLPEAARPKLLEAKELARYRYFLDRVFLGARHKLSEAEEKLTALASNPACEMWVDMTNKRESALTVEHEGKQIPLAEAFGRVTTTHDTAARRALYARINAALKGIAPYAEAEMNAVYSWKKIQDELRGFASPEEETLLAYEVSPKTVAALRKAVVDAFPLARRFYAAKAKLLGLPHLEYADRNVDLPPREGGAAEWKPNFREACATLSEILGPVGPWYRETFRRYLERGQIDADPRQGKSGGGYCYKTRGNPTYVFLNHEPSPNAFKTLAHEMGHAFHYEHAAAQPALYEGYSMATAESASTFFERLAFEKMVADAPSPEARFRLLFGKANDFVSTVFRQIACFNLEMSLHRRVRAEGYLPAAEMAREHNRAMAEYLGPAVRVDEDNGYMFVSWSHLRRPFYVFSYAFGELVANALYEKYRATGDVAAFERFMKAGGSDTVENIFAASGLDVTKPAFWKKGLAAFERMVEEIEAEAANRGKAKKR
jgi:oligoendopeptidase F